MGEAREKAQLIKDALKLVDDLGKLTISDPMTDDDYDDVDDFIDRAKKLKKNRWWKLT